MPDRRGRIITFYSYKGGTGRTMALANVAWILASNGYRVLAVDWDLESPGLHRYLHPFLVDKQLKTTTGVIDLIRDYAAETMSPDRADDPGWYRQLARLSGRAVGLQFDFPHDGSFDLLAAGLQDDFYSKAVSTFDWSAFYDQLGGGVFLDVLADAMRAEYDYTLIDSRTGLTDTAGVCTGQLADLVLNCFTFSTQSIDGARAVERSLAAIRGADGPRVLPVPMRVEDGEQSKLEAGRDYARAVFGHFVPGPEPDARDRYWGDVEIPYKPFYAYEEILAAVAERPRQENTLLAAYERLTGAVTDGRVNELQPIDETDRRRWLTEYERLPARIPGRIRISYAPEDRLWADWIEAHLSAAGLPVILDSIVRGLANGTRTGTDGGGAGAGGVPADRTMVLLSPDYVASPVGQEVWRRALEADPTAAQHLVIPVRVSAVPLPEPFTRRAMVDVVGPRPQQALAALLAAVEQRAAARQLPTLLDIPRHPASTPAVSNIGGRNAAFTGRGEVLERLRDDLRVGVAVVLPQALFGMGGVGKTQVALEYAHRFAADYDVVWWISAEQPTAARRSLAELAEQLKVPTGGNMNETAIAVREALRRGAPYTRWLLVFDNAENPDDLTQYIPRQGTGHVVVTSRNQDWAKRFDHVEIDVFARAESVQLLIRRCPSLRSQDATRVAEALGDLPLAVEQAGAWLSSTGMAVDEYLQRLSDQTLRQLDDAGSPADYPYTAAATWLVSVDGLRERSAAAARLLELCAFFSPEPIPMSLLTGDHMIDLLRAYDPMLDRTLLLAPLITQLGRFALARTDQAQQVVQVHRLVQAVLRDRMSAEEREQARRQVQDLLASSRAVDPDDQDQWKWFAELLPHLEPTEAISATDNKVLALVENSVRYMWTVSDFDAAQELAEKVIDIRIGLFGADDPRTLVMGHHIANALRSKADYNASYRLEQDYLERMRAALRLGPGDDHPYLLQLQRGIAADLRGLGKYQEARAVEEDLYPRYSLVYGEDHRETLAVANNLALSLQLAGLSVQARELAERTLQQSRRSLGANHTWTLGFANNVARAMREAGDFVASRQLQEETLQRYQGILNPERQRLLRASQNLAVTLRKLGEFEAAREMSAETLERYREQHGRDQPDTLSCAVCLACDLLALRRDAEARDLLEDTLPRYQAKLGDEHPFTLACRNNFAIVLRTTGERPRARQLAQDTWEAYRRVLGERHPHSLGCAVNVANSTYDAGDFEAALSLDTDTYAAYREILGDLHPDTLACGANLSVSLRAAGDSQGSRELRDEILIKIRDVLGPTHPNVARVSAGTRLNCDIEPPLI
jgi:hypothetical protein